MLTAEQASDCAVLVTWDEYLRPIDGWLFHLDGRHDIGTARRWLKLRAHATKGLARRVEESRN